MKPSLILLLTLLAVPAHADGVILFVDDGKVRAVDPNPGAALQELVALPSGFEATRIDVADSGDLIIIGSNDVVLHRAPGADTLVRSVCLRNAHASPGGHLILCETDRGPALVAVTRDLQRPLPAGIEDLAFVGGATGPGWLLGRRGDEVVLVRVAAPATLHTVGRFAGIRGIVASPSGEHAVALHGEGEDQRVVVFSLRADGAPRILGGPAEIVVWAPDSRWVGLQFGATEEDEPNACAVRAAGGEMMCWTGYVLLGFSPDSKQVLLRRGNEIGVAAIAGTKAPTPRKVVTTTGPAVWTHRMK